jgi:dipeptidyl aminopeptidase/acylaminoacyl peptidase
MQASQKSRGLVSWLVLLAAAVPGSWQVAQAADVATYAHTVANERMAISPDGNRIAMVRVVDDNRIISVVGVDDQKVSFNAAVGPVAVWMVSWVDGGHLLVGTVSNAVNGQLRAGQGFQGRNLGLLDLATGKMADPYDVNAEVKMVNLVTGSPRIRLDPDGKAFIALTGNYFSGADRFKALITRRMGGTSQLAASKQRDLIDWVIGDNGSVVARLRYNGAGRRWTIEVAQGQSFVDAASGEGDVDMPSLLGLSPDGKALWVQFTEGEDMQVRRIPLDAPALGDRVRALDKLRMAVTDRYSDRVYGAYMGEAHTLQYFETHAREGWDAVRAALPGTAIRVVSRSDDEMRWLVNADNDKAGPMYVLVDRRQGKVVPLGPSFNGLDGVPIPKPVSYKAGDGRVIQGWLTLPRGRPESKLPLVVLAQDFPQGQSFGNYHPLGQMIASLGYAVLQANVRGSSQDRVQTVAGFGELGARTLSDLTDGVAWLASEGTIDPARSCIVGSAFGGYSALESVAQADNRFRCAVSLGGVSDLHLYRREEVATPGAPARVIESFDRQVGSSAPDDPKLYERSPAQHAAAIGVPVLLVHARDDGTVNYSESVAMAEALKKAGKEASFVTIDHGNHGFDLQPGRVQAFEAVAAFLKARNPP